VPIDCVDMNLLPGGRNGIVLNVCSEEFRESCIKNKNCPVAYIFMVETLSRELLIQSTR
jgi:hypothetical protein